MSVAVCLLLSVAAGSARCAPAKASAGEAVRSFRFGHLVTADALDDRLLVVRAWPRRLWLLRVDDDCDLTRATSQLGVTSSLGIVSVNRDRVKFASLQPHGACRIRQIRPLELELAVAADD